MISVFLVSFGSSVAAATTVSVNLATELNRRDEPLLHLLFVGIGRKIEHVEASVRLRQSLVVPAHSVHSVASGLVGDVDWQLGSSGHKLEIELLVLLRELFQNFPECVVKGSSVVEHTAHLIAPVGVLLEQANVDQLVAACAELGIPPAAVRHCLGAQHVVDSSLELVHLHLVFGQNRIDRKPDVVFVILEINLLVEAAWDKLNGPSLLTASNRHREVLLNDQLVGLVVTALRGSLPYVRNFVELVHVGSLEVVQGEVSLSHNSLPDCGMEHQIKGLASADCIADPASHHEKHLKLFLRDRQMVEHEHISHHSN